MHAKILKFYSSSSTPPLLPSCPFIYRNIYYTNSYTDIEIIIVTRLYHQLIINNNEFMTKYDFNFYLYSFHEERGQTFFRNFIRVIE